MSTYKIPTAPDVDTVWVSEPGGDRPFRWVRAGVNTWRGEDGVIVAWIELLALGEVSDAHPDLPADAPLPWRVDSEDGVVDANEDAVRLGLRLGPFVVKAVNAYGERVAGGGTNYARLNADMRGEVRDLNAELDAVLGEVRELLDAKPWDIGPHVLKLRARLDRA